MRGLGDEKQPLYVERLEEDAKVWAAPRTYIARWYTNTSTYGDIGCEMLIFSLLSL